MAMETQLQIRQNAQEVQEYLSELHAWQKTMKGKQPGTSISTTAGASSSVSKTSSSSIPGPRGRAGRAAVGPAPAELQVPALSQPSNAAGSTSTVRDMPATRQQVASKDSNGSAAGHTYSSYAKWDKLNVDALLASDSDTEDAAGKPSQAHQAAKKVAASTAGGRGEGGNLAASALHTPDIRLPPQQADLSTAELRAVHSTRKAAPTAAAPSTTPQHSQQPPVRNSQPQTADGWRTRGNDLFKAGQHTYAKDCYSRSIQMDPSNAAAYANRALVELKLGQWAEAEDDCTQALTLDGGYTKAYHRRGTAREQLGQLLAACQDFEDAFRLEPDNKALLADRDAALAAHMSTACIPALTHRVQLHCKLGATPTTMQPSVATDTVQGGASVPTVPRTLTQSQQSPTPQGAATQVSNTPKSSVIAGGGSAEATPAAAAAVSMGKDSLCHSASSGTSGRVSSSGGATATSDQKARLAAAAAAAAQQLSARMMEQVKAPRTSTEFEATWRSLSSDAAAQLSYLQLLTPAQLPSVFKASLTPQLLTSILKVLLQCLTMQQPGADSTRTACWSLTHAVAFLQGLCQVPRVEMAAMCIGSKQKQELHALWAAAFESSNQCMTSELKQACTTVKKVLRL